MVYKNYIIEKNKYNIYNFNAATYAFRHEDDTDGQEFWGETIEQCKELIDDLE